LRRLTTESRSAGSHVEWEKCFWLPDAGLYGRFGHLHPAETGPLIHLLVTVDDAEESVCMFADSVIQNFKVRHVAREIDVHITPIVLTRSEHPDKSVVSVRNLSSGYNVELPDSDIAPPIILGIVCNLMSLHRASVRSFPHHTQGGVANNSRERWLRRLLFWHFRAFLAGFR
jgi:hypothetical protein